jgi:uncharacterized spore protein YtfJ
MVTAGHRERSTMDVQDLLNKVAQNLSVTRAFGTAYEKDGSMVIPVAFVSGGGGAGEGTAGTASASSEDGDVVRDSEAADAETPGGSGGGFGGVVLPVGVYVVKDEKVRWIPAVNANLIIVVVFITLRMILRARFRAQRRAH